MYHVPTKGDLDRNLSAILHDAHQKARAEKMRLTSEFAARGMGSSTPLISAVVGVLDGIHKEAMNRSIPILGDFAERMQVEPSHIVMIARPHLENMGNSVLGELPPAGFPQVHQQIRRQYALVFKQRLDGALRDFEIGFVGGRSVAALKHVETPPQSLPSEKKPADLLILRPTIWGMGVDLKEAARRFRERWARKR